MLSVQKSTVYFLRYIRHRLAKIKNLEVFDMTQFSKFRILALSAGFATMAVLATLAQAGRAQASSGLSQCAGSSSQTVINCCNRFVSDQPQLWRRQSHTSCGRAVGCRSSGVSLTSAKRVKRCYIVQPIKELMKGNDHDGETESR